MFAFLNFFYFPSSHLFRWQYLHKYCILVLYVTIGIDKMKIHTKKQWVISNCHKKIYSKEIAEEKLVADTIYSTWSITSCEQQQQQYLGDGAIIKVIPVPVLGVAAIACIVSSASCSMMANDPRQIVHSLNSKLVFVYIQCVTTLTHQKWCSLTQGWGLRIRHFFPRIRIRLSWQNIPDPTWKRNEAWICWFWFIFCSRWK